MGCLAPNAVKLRSICLGFGLAFATQNGVFSFGGELMFFIIYRQKVEKNSVPTIHIGCHLSFSPSSQPCQLSPSIIINNVRKKYNHLPLVTYNHYSESKYVCLKNKNDFISF